MAPPRRSISDDARYLGGFAGAALGYRYVFLVAELALFNSCADASSGGRTLDLSSPVVVPSWPFRIVF